MVVEFWATWCPPCRQSIPHISQLQRDYRDKKRQVKFIGVTSEPESVAGPFVKKLSRTQLDYTMLSDEDETLHGLLMVPSRARGIPTAFVIDASGTVVFTGHPGDPQMNKAIASALTSSAVPLEPIPSRDELSAMPIKALKALMAAHGVSALGLAEKSELVDALAAKKA